MELHQGTAIRREIRDPVHKYIRVTNIENAVLDAQPFARLANIAQMHSAHLVYPGATYSRKSHSLGVMHIAGRMITHILYLQYQPAIDKISHPLFFCDTPLRRERWQIQRNLPLRDWLREEGITLTDERDVAPYIVQATRLAGLLHDIGHGPYSHLFESASEETKEEQDAAGRQRPLRFNHEAMGVRIVREGFLELTHRKPKLLTEQDLDFVSRIIGNSLTTNLSFLSDLISSPLDADKMDYLLRDSHYAGTPEYGTIDLDRILDALLVHEGELKYASDGLDAIVSGLNAMFFMYNNVYLHKRVRAFDLAALTDLRAINGELRNFERTPEEFLQLDDATFLTWLAERARTESAQEAVRFRTALRGIHALRHREKTIDIVVDGRIAISIADARSTPAYSDVVTSVRKRVEKYLEQEQKETGVQLLVDAEKNIRPIGVKPDEIIPFLTDLVIFDVRTGELVQFTEFEPHYKTLTRIVVPLRVYAARTETEKLSEAQIQRVRAATLEILRKEQAVQTATR